MGNEAVISTEILETYPEPDIDLINSELEKELNGFTHKVIVLDDDPTGTQTVHGISVFTDWNTESLHEGFAEENSMFYVLTNSRGMTSAQTEKIHNEIIRMLNRFQRKQEKITAL